MRLYDVALLLITGIGALGCILFVILYIRREPLTDSAVDLEARRFLLASYGCLGSLFTLIIINRIFGPGWYGREVVTAILFTIYAVFAWWPLRLLSETTKKASQRNGG